MKGTTITIVYEVDPKYVRVNLEELGITGEMDDPEIMAAIESAADDHLQMNAVPFVTNMDEVMAWVRRAMAEKAREAQP